MNRSKISVEHVLLTVVKPFDEFISALEVPLGHFDESVTMNRSSGLRGCV